MCYDMLLLLRSDDTLLWNCLSEDSLQRDLQLKLLTLTSFKTVAQNKLCVYYAAFILYVY